MVLHLIFWRRREFGAEPWLHGYLYRPQHSGEQRSRQFEESDDNNDWTRA